MCVLCQMFTGDPNIAERMLYAAYIDPGSGYVFQSVLPMIVGFIATVFGSILFFFRNKIFPLITKHKLLVVSLIFLGVVGTMIVVGKNIMSIRKIDKKVVIIGLDGMDHKFLDAGFKRNLLPNLKKIADTGTYTNLATSVPPQSPVAWASFMTGSWPARHGVYDFIERNPSDYSLDLVFSKPQIRKLGVPAFWETTTKYKVPTSILFLPDTFPASPLDGKMISGMGVPDILGTVGTFTLFTTKQEKLDPKWRGKMTLIAKGKEIKTKIEGPKFNYLKEKKVTEIPLAIENDAKNKKVTLRVQNQTVNLKEKEFSKWVKLEFKIDFFTRIHGIAKFYLRQVGPDLEIYLSPINFDPEQPVYPISYPKNYSKEIAREYGQFPTLGLPNDTWALEEGIFDDAAFEKHSDSILEERKKIILGELKKFKGGIFFGYFGATDTISHMYWRFLNDAQSTKHKTIMNYYVKMDKVIGEINKNLGPKDTLMIMSDHGFDSFDYEMNVNTWLRENGYLVLQDGKEIGGELLSDIDWSKTKAYAIGYNEIYLNLAGREEQGIVNQEEADSLIKEISLKLSTVVNPLTNEKVMKNLYDRKSLGISTNDTNAPDLFLGFYKGLRASWDTAVGATPADIFKKRDSKWSGDHLFDPTEVPGVLLVNKKIKKSDPQIIDMIPSALSLFDLPIKQYQGKKLF